jgi:hypothetical protein
MPACATSPGPKSGHGHVRLAPCHQVTCRPSRVPPPRRNVALRHALASSPGLLPRPLRSPHRLRAEARRLRGAPAAAPAGDEPVVPAGRASPKWDAAPGADHWLAGLSTSTALRAWRRPSRSSFATLPERCRPARRRSGPPADPAAAPKRGIGTVGLPGRRSSLSTTARLLPRGPKPVRRQVCRGRSFR